MTWILHYHKYLLHKKNGKFKFSSYLYGDKNRKKIYEKNYINSYVIADEKREIMYMYRFKL